MMFQSSSSQVPNKRGGFPIIRGLGKLPKFSKQGVKINGGPEFYKWLKIVIKQRKEQKQAVTKGKGLPWKLGVNSSSKERD